MEETSLVLLNYDNKWTFLKIIYIHVYFIKMFCFVFLFFLSINTSKNEIITVYNTEEYSSTDILLVIIYQPTSWIIDNLMSYLPVWKKSTPINKSGLDVSHKLLSRLSRLSRTAHTALENSTAVSLKSFCFHSSGFQAPSVLQGLTTVTWNLQRLTPIKIFNFMA